MVAAISGALAAVAAVLFGVDRTDIVLDAYLVFLAGVLALAAARIAAHAFPGPRGVVPRLLVRVPRRATKPESLKLAEEVVALAQADQFDLHFRLRPVLVDIAGAGLAGRAGIDLAAEPERAAAQLSPEAWELVRPDRPRPGGTGARGIDTGSLSKIVAELERTLPS